MRLCRTVHQRAESREARSRRGRGASRALSRLTVAGCLVTSLASGLALAAPGVAAAQPDPWLISTYAGNGSQGNAIAGTSASFAFPRQVAVDSDGNILIADTFGQKVRVLAASSGSFYGRAMTAGDVYDVAGNGSPGTGADGVAATSSNLGYPSGTALDASGNVLIGDTSNNRIQVIAATTGTFYGQSMTAGDAYTVAGDGTYGFSGDGGPATAAELADPAYVAVDSHGNLLIADQFNNRIRVVAETSGTFYGVTMTAGDIYTVAGNGTAGYNGDDIAATSAELNGPQSAVADSSGNLVISDNGNSRIRVVAGSTGTFYGQSMKAGDIYTVAGDGTAGYTGDGGAATSAEIDNQFGAAQVDPSGNLVINDSNNGAVRVVASKAGTFYGQAMKAHHIYTVAGDGTLGDSGDGGPATSAELGFTDSTAFDASGNLIIDDGDNVRVVAVASGTFYGQSMTAGDIYTVAGNDTFGFSGDGGPATSAELNEPFGIATGPSGEPSLVLSDSSNNRLRMVAGTSGTFYGQPMTAGDIYTIAGDGTSGHSGTGGLATSAELDGPTAVAVDANGNALVGDGSEVQVIASSTGTFYGKSMTAGHIYTVAGNGTFGYKGIGGKATSAEIGEPNGLALDSSGNIVLTDPGNERILVVAESTGTFYGKAMTAGHIYLIAGDGKDGYSGNGGPATSAKLASPEGLSVDSSGNVVFADAGNNRIRVVAEATGTFYGVAMTVGDIYSVTGNGSLGYSGDGGLAKKAKLNHPDDVIVDTSGNLVITDAHNNVVRVVAGSSGDFYGLTMTAHHIYTIAGTGASGYSGDGGAPTAAQLANPISVVAQPAGDRGQGEALYVTESGNSRVRQLIPNLG